MRNLDNLRLEYFVELMQKGGDKKWNQSMDIDEKAILLKTRLRTAGPNQGRVIAKKVEQLNERARKTRKLSSLDYDIAASLEYSMDKED